MEKIITEIIRKYRFLTPEAIAAGIVKRLKEIEYTRSESKRYQKEKQDARKRYDETVAQIDVQLGTLRKKCTHEETQYYGDPAGGNDSYTECLICGASI